MRTWLFFTICHNIPNHVIQATVHSEYSEAGWHKHLDAGMFLKHWCQGIYLIPGIMDRFEYIIILKEIMPLKWVFQKYNNPKHNSKRATSCFLANRIEVMECPSQSPDLYSVENLWGDIKNAVSEEKTRYAEELWNVIPSSWTGKPARSWSTPCNTDVQQFSETLLINFSHDVTVALHGHLSDRFTHWYHFFSLW